MPGRWYNASRNTECDKKQGAVKELLLFFHSPQSIDKVSEERGFHQK